MINIKVIIISIIVIFLLKLIENNNFFDKNKFKKFNIDNKQKFIKFNYKDLKIFASLKNNEFNNTNTTITNNIIKISDKLLFSLENDKKNEIFKFFLKKNLKDLNQNKIRYLEESDNEIYLPKLYIDFENNKFPELFCTNNSSCNNHGFCYNNTLCKCDQFYTTYYKKDLMKNNFTQCNYLQLGLKSIFALSFFLGPLSLEHILMGNILTGIVKLVFPMILILIGNSVFILGKFKNSNKLQILGKIFELLATIIIILWWITDWILIISGHYKDHKGVDFYNDLF